MNDPKIAGAQIREKESIWLPEVLEKSQPIPAKRYFKGFFFFRFQRNDDWVRWRIPEGQTDSGASEELSQEVVKPGVHKCFL